MKNRATQLKSAIQAFCKSVIEFLGLDRPRAYRPEAHYMRGPGPKWRARYGNPQRVLARTTRSAGSRTF